MQYHEAHQRVSESETQVQPALADAKRLRKQRDHAIRELEGNLAVAVKAQQLADEAQFEDLPHLKLAERARELARLADGKERVHKPELASQAESCARAAGTKEQTLREELSKVQSEGGLLQAKIDTLPTEEQCDQALVRFEHTLKLQEPLGKKTIAIRELCDLLHEHGIDYKPVISKLRSD
jgi:hypothetical protein